MTQLVAVDIGGTNARFALAEIGADGTIAMDEPITLATSDYTSLETAWEAFAARVGLPVPKAASIALAGPVTGDLVQLTNNSWTIQTGHLDAQLGLDQFTVLNDFAAVAHAAATVPDDLFEYLAGPDVPMPRTGTISVIGPGTGLGVAHFHRSPEGFYVQATEGGHIDFAPLDAVEDAILHRLRERHRRVSVERVVSGPGVVDIHRTLATLEKREVQTLEDRTIWQRGLAGEDTLCSAAVERFCLSLGSVAGDYALAHGASGVVIAGGLGYRIRERLKASGFAKRFVAKGRYEAMMSSIPVRLVTHPQPGLLGAAAAFAKEHLS